MPTKTGQNPQPPAAMPTDKAGLIFLKDGAPVQPNPAVIESYVTDALQRRGHWPSTADITSAMLDRLQRAAL